MLGDCLNLWLVTILLLYSVVPSVMTINCYLCDSIDDEGCEDPFNSTLYKPMDCENENFACVKQDKINKELNRTYLHRGCIQKHYCEILAKASDFCVTCTTDYCNTAWGLISQRYLCFLVFVLNVFSYYSYIRLV